MTKIAPLQKKEIDLLSGVLSDVHKNAAKEHRAGIEALQSRLDDWAARIAVIGQVKAGKSTFLNALLHMTDFLPSDVNPWTSVVTNIRINLKNDPATGARFDFFSEEDWDEIINGNRELRNLTEEMLPGFDLDLLREQTEAMRARAKRRLGKHYHALLGQSHEYDFLNGDVLQRYVCAGSDHDLTNESQGRYATITKVANAYMRRPEFAVPVILTDTPGVNDPFLVRDEFTCRSLDKSDVFIVVLSAHQALTSVDIALIRLLAMQDTKDVIIYVNRIDELDDYAVEVPRVLDDVETRLRKAVPGIEFTIIAGSAYMAEIALRSDEQAAHLRDTLDTPELHDYLRQIVGHVPEDQVDRLLIGSGLDELKRTMSMVIDNGIGSRQMANIYEDARAEIGAISYATRRERESVQMQADKLGQMDPGSALHDLEGEIETLSALQKQIDTHIEDANKALERLIDKSWGRLESALNDGVRRFVDDELTKLRGQSVRENVTGHTRKEQHIGLGDLHQQFEVVMRQHFEKARAGIDVSLNNVLSACTNLLSQNFSHLLSDVTLDDLPHDEFTSTVALAKKEIVLPIVRDRGWAFWRKSSMNLEKTMDGLKTLSYAELKPVVEKITNVFNDAQIERASVGMGRVGVLLRMVDMAVTERQQRLRRDRRQMQNGADASDNAHAVADRLQSQLEILEHRLQLLSVAAHTLARSTISQAA